MDQQHIIELHKRIEKLETDSKWELSKMRIVIIGVLIYIVATTIYYFIGEEKYYLNSIVPTSSFIASLLILPPMKHFWIKKVKNN